MSRLRFAMSQCTFATSLFFSFDRFALLSSLSKLLQRKRKEGERERGKRRKACHESGAFCHESAPLPIF